MKEMIENSPEETKWYAVWTHSRQEKAAGARLEALGIPFFLPLKSELRQWSDRKQIVETPLFSGYLFVRLDLMKGNRLAVLKTPGVVSLVGNHTGPLPIPDEQIESIRTVLTSGASFSDHEALNAGDRVRVIRGALSGVEGTLLRAHSRNWLVVSVDMIQRSIAVSVSRDDVVLVNTHAA